MKRYNLLLWFIIGLLPIINACRKDHRDIERELDNSTGLDLNFSFVNKPDPGTELIAYLYYADNENEPFYKKDPAQVLRHDLRAQDIEQGLTLTFEEPIPTSFAYVIAFADVDSNGEISDGDIAICYLAQSVKEVMGGVAPAENVSHRKFLTMKMDQVYSSKRPPLEVKLTFPLPPLPGATFELGLYYAETEDESLVDREPDMLQRHILTEADIEDGLTLTFEEVEDVPYLFARAHVDIDKDEALSYGDMAMFYGEKTINEVLEDNVSPENIGPRSHIDITMSLWHANETDPPIDIDGNEYTILKIGEQEWIAENLKVTRYRTGVPIPTDFSNAEWSGLNAGAYAVYPFDQTNGVIASEEEMIEKYGLLYNGHAVADERGLAPAGWRIATDEDFKALERAAGMSEDEIENTGARGTVAGKLISAAVSGGTDDFGFSALPNGSRQGGNGEFITFNGFNGFRIWTGTPIADTPNANLYTRILQSTTGAINRGGQGRRMGFSVRCVRDTK